MRRELLELKNSHRRRAVVGVLSDLRAEAGILTRKHEFGHGETVNLGCNQRRLRFPGNHAAKGMAQALSVAERGVSRPAGAVGCRGTRSYIAFKSSAVYPVPIPAPKKTNHSLP